MDKLNRRSMLQLLGAAPVAAGFTWTDVEAAQAARQTKAAQAAPAAAFCLYLAARRGRLGDRSHQTAGTLVTDAGAASW